MSSTARRKATALRQVTLIGAPSHVIPEPLQSTPPPDPLLSQATKEVNKTGKALKQLLSQATKEDNNTLDVEHNSDSDSDSDSDPSHLEIDYASDSDVAITAIPCEMNSD